jgi:dienelactone hydrolase
VVAADNTDKGAHPTQVTTSPGSEDSPAWSPDGMWIAYEASQIPSSSSTAPVTLASRPLAAASQNPHPVPDRMSTEPRFSPDGKFIYFIADDDGTQNLCRVPAAGGEITRPIGGRLMLYSYSVAKSGEVAALITTPDRPSEIFTIPDGKLTRITHVNDAFISQVKLTAPEYVKFKSKDGTIVSGYLYKPIDYVAGKKYPAILRPHGGPVWAYYAEFTPLAQLFAANGYVVLYPNPRGSTGYGQAYAKAIDADWGNKDFQDDMAMVDYAIAQGLVDPGKLGVGGWSYGGISTDFIITQTTRFKAAISGAGAALFASMYGHDRYIRDYEYELGYPWKDRAVWDKVSPFYKIENVTTPTLFMGGDIDWNVPILGGEQMYQALKSLGRETELVVYPGEYHEFKAPSHLKDRLNATWPGMPTMSKQTVPRLGRPRLEGRPLKPAKPRGAGAPGPAGRSPAGFRRGKHKLKSSCARRPDDGVRAQRDSPEQGINHSAASRRCILDKGSMRIFEYLKAIKSPSFAWLGWWRSPWTPSRSVLCHCLSPEDCRRPMPYRCSRSRNSIQLLGWHWPFCLHWRRSWFRDSICFPPDGGGFSPASRFIRESLRFCLRACAAPGRKPRGRALSSRKRRGSGTRRAKKAPTRLSPGALVEQPLPRKAVLQHNLGGGFQQVLNTAESRVPDLSNRSFNAKRRPL